VHQAAFSYMYLPFIVFSGMGPDFRVLVRKSRKQAQQYYQLYKVCFLTVHLF
jgi:20S proteasome alpha/beta subunit